MESSFDKQQMSEWLKEVLPNALEECKVPKPEDEVIIVYEVNRLFDWVKINRLKRNYPNSIIVPFVTEHLTYSTGIAIELALPALLIKPLQKSKFLRIVKSCIRPIRKKGEYTYNA